LRKGIPMIAVAAVALYVALVLLERFLVEHGYRVG
jgi:hypothetical protein